MTKYFFIDFDNTIFSHRTFTIPEQAYAALTKLQKEGHKFILASGRPFRSDSKDLADFGLKPDCLISANSAIIEAEGKLLRKAFIDPGRQRQLLDYILEKDYCLLASHGSQWYVSKLDPSSSALQDERFLGKILTGKDFLALYDIPMPSFFLSDSPEAIADVQSHFPDFSLLRMGNELSGADVIPKTNNKAAGIPIILNYYGASLEDTVAIGDSMNDLGMIQTANLGIAMGNAMPELKEAADHIAPDIDENGLTEAIRYALRQLSSARI